MPKTTETECELSAVIAKYKEDISWTAELDFPVDIYDKSDSPAHGVIKLPNIGRESHTYLTHIVRNYPQFCDYTVFLQGSPFFHLEENAGPRELLKLIHLTISKSVPFKGLAWFKSRCDRLGRPHHMDDPAKKGKWPGWGKDIPVGEAFERLFRKEAPKEFLASAMTGNFIVRKDRILTRPLEFYQNALAIIENDPHDESNTGHAFERLWQIIFNGNSRLNP